LTDLRSAVAGVTVSADLAGRMYFRDSDGDLAVELAKVYGDKVELGLEPGTYSVVLDTTKGGRYGGEIRVTTRQKVVLTSAMLKPVTLTQTAARGAEEPAQESPQPEAEPEPKKAAAAAPGPGDVVGAVVGAAVGSALGKAVGDAVGTAVNAAITAAQTAAPKDAVSAPKDAAPGAAAGRDTGRPKKAEKAPVDDTGPQTSLFHISFLPDFRGGLFASRDENIISINLLAGSSAASRGFEVGGLANLESGDVIGFQAAGLANVALGKLGGFQAAGLVNYVEGDALFFQSAGLVNVSGGFSGVQSAGLANVARGDVNGVQLAGLLNWSDGTTVGTQVSGLANWSARFIGPQISVVNVADTVTGAQIGVVNIARVVTGTQVGVFNFARHVDGVPVGLISLDLDGRHDVALWVDLDGTAYASLSLGGKHLYTVASAGWNPISGSDAWTLGLGLGGRTDVGPLYLDYDLSLVSLLSTANGWGSDPTGSMYPRIRAVVGLPILGSLSIEAGVVLRMLVPTLSSSIPGADASSVVVQPGFIVGLAL
ncbi:MAG TPA: hypothetical protein VHE79_10595, partial [Spirochaetia bacterium]